MEAVAGLEDVAGVEVAVEADRRIAAGPFEARLDPAEQLTREVGILLLVLGWQEALVEQEAA